MTCLQHVLPFKDSRAFWSDRIVRKARELGIALPDESGNIACWWRPRYLSRSILTEEGYELLKPRIRDEEKYRREVADFWLQVSGVVITVVGLLLEILELLLKH